MRTSECNSEQEANYNFLAWLLTDPANQVLSKNPYTRIEKGCLMEIKLSYSIVTSQLSVKITEDGRYLKTLLIPLPSAYEEFEDFESYFDVEFPPEEYGAVPGLVLPTGYYAIGVYVGKTLKRILLSGPNLSYVATSIDEVYDEVSANQRRQRERSVQTTPKI